MRITIDYCEPIPRIGQFFAEFEKPGNIHSGSLRISV
jgi:hypothetical protein